MAYCFINLNSLAELTISIGQSGRIPLFYKYMEQVASRRALDCQVVDLCICFIMELNIVYDSCHAAQQNDDDLK